MKTVESFWQEFREAELNARYIRRSSRRTNPQLRGTVSFGDTPEECDALVDMILENRCTALIMSLDRYLESGAQIPTANDYRILLDSSGEPRCVLRSTGTHIVPLRQMKGEYTYAASHPAPVRKAEEKKRSLFSQKRNEDIEEKAPAYELPTDADYANSLHYWMQETRPLLVNECAARGQQFSMEMPMLVDTFIPVYPLPQEQDA